MDEKFWSNQWGDKILFSHGTNRSAGVAILLNNFPGKVLTTNGDSLGHWILCVLEANDDFLILGNIYGYNNPNQNKNMFSEITKTIKDLCQRYPTNNFIFGGDYNMVMDEWLVRSPSKYQRHFYNPLLLDFCSVFNLKDVWRFDNPYTQIYMWFKPDGSIKSRIDFWLVSDNRPGLDPTSIISAAPLTDHCLIKLNFMSTNKCFKKRYWKFNSNLLKSELFCQEIITVISNITTDSNLLTYRSKWEYLKYKLHQISISNSKILSRESKEKEMEIITEINSICNKSSLNENSKQKLILLQSSLDNIYLSKAKGAYIRSRAKWIEEGERSSAYFCRLEKRRQEGNAIRTLLIDNQECTENVGNL